METFLLFGKAMGWFFVYVLAAAFAATLLYGLSYALRYATRFVPAPAAGAGSVLRLPSFRQLLLFGGLCLAGYVVYLVSQGSFPTIAINKAIVGQIIWIAGIAVALCLLYYLSGKARNIFVATIAAIVAICAGGYIAHLAENDFDRNKSWPFNDSVANATASGTPAAPRVSPNGTIPMNVANNAPVAQAPACSMGHVAWYELKPRERIRNANNCDLVARVMQGEVKFFLDDGTQKTMRPNTPDCEGNSCGKKKAIVEIVNETTDTVAIRFTACQPGRWAPGTWNCGR